MRLNIEKWAEILSESAESISIDFEKANIYGSDEFYQASTLIVEPKGMDDGWYKFMENDINNWVGFVVNVCGSQWLPIAKHVAENGY